METGDRPNLSGSKVEFRPLHEQVRQTLWESLIAGELRPGDRIVESKVAKELGVSQSTVREALRALEQIGVVTTSPHRGAFVNAITPTDAMEMYSTRALLEGRAIELAVSRVGPSEIRQLEDLLGQMREAAAAEDLGSLVQLDVSFHRHICEFSGQRLLTRLWSSVDPLGWTMVTGKRLFRHRLQEMVERHEPILKVLREGDAARARQVIESHIMDMGREVTSSAEAEVALL